MINDVLHIIHTDIRGNDIKILATQRRKQNYLDQCNQQQIKFVVVPGVTTESTVFHNINLAHKKVVQLAKDCDYQNVIIAEDDIVFTAPGAWKYFLSKIPAIYDIFCGVIYAGQVDDGVISSPFSGGMTLYSVHKRFYNKILGMPKEVHIDRWLGEQHQYNLLYACQPYVCKQLGGFSFNHGTFFEYGVYEAGKEFYSGN